MKIKIYCMDAEGVIRCGLITSNETMAENFIRRKNLLGFITIKKKGE